MTPSQPHSRHLDTPAADRRQEACIACAVTALVLYGTALALPMVTATRFGLSKDGYLLTSTLALWRDGFPPLALLLGFVGVAAPLALGLSLLLSHGLLRQGYALPRLRRILSLTTKLEEWSLPDVHLLGVMVAFTKLSSLVDTRLGPGFWCYAAAALLTWLAWYFHRPHVYVRQTEALAPRGVLHE